MSNVNENVKDLLQKVSEQTMTKHLSPEILNNDGPLQVYLIGQPQENLFGILHTILDGIEPLNRPLMHGFTCSIGYSDNSGTFIGENPADMVEIGNTLFQFDEPEGKTSFDIFLNAPLLKNVQFHIISSENEFEDVDWEDIILHADICMFSLSATALLSMVQRKILKTYLMPTMGEQLYIILVNDNLIIEADHADIDASLVRFFGNATTVFRTPDYDEERMVETLMQLSQNIDEVRKARAHRAECYLLRNALKDVDTHISALSNNFEQLDEAIELMSEKAKQLPNRHESICRKMRIQFLSPLKLSASQEISQFYQVLLDRLHDEIAKASDAAAISEILPAYIRDQWNHEAENLTGMINRAGTTFQNDFVGFVEQDVREYLAEGSNMDTASYILRVADIYINKWDNLNNTDTAEFHFDQAEDRTKIMKYGVIASGVALALMAHPIIGTAVAVLGSRKAVKMESNRINEINRQGMISAADAMCRSVYDDMNMWLEQVFAAIEKDMSACVQDCYQKLMATIVKALNSKRSEKENFAEQLEMLNELKASIEAHL